MPGQHQESSEDDDPFDDYSNDTEVGVGFSDQVLLLVSVVGFGVMTLLVYGFIVSRTKSADELVGEDGEVDYEEELLRSDVAHLNRAQRRARAKALMKRQRRAAPSDTNQQPHDDDDDNNDNNVLQRIEGDHREEEEEVHSNTHHLSRKERNAAAKPAEKKARHLLEEERREEQRQAMQTAKEEKKKRLQLEEAQAREEKIAREQKRERQRQANFDQWNTFLASPDGTTKITVEEWVQELLGVGGRSIVPLGELTSRFNTSLQEVTDRIRQLVQEGRVTGVLEEEQGLFIRLTHEHMLSLASLVQQKGEVSLQDLSRATIELVVVGNSKNQ